MGAQLVFINRVAGAEGNSGDGNFAIYRVGCTDDASFEDRWMLVKCLFHFLWRDVGPASNNELLEAALKLVVAVLVAGSQIAGVQPAVFEQTFGGMGIVPVANAIGGAANKDFPGLAREHIMAVPID